MKNTDCNENTQDNWTTVRAFPSPVEAQLAKCHLENAGIPAFVRDEHTIGMNPLYSIAMGGVRLDVPESRLAQAQELLGSGCDEAPVACPACGGGAERAANPARKGLALLAWLLAAVPFLFLRESWNCRVCGHRWRR